MNTRIKQIALAVTVAGLAVLGASAPATAHAAPMKHSTLWCC